MLVSIQINATPCHEQTRLTKRLDALDKCLKSGKPGLSPKQKRQNPETYVFFALARYLEDVYGYSFANTQAKSNNS